MALQNRVLPTGEIVADPSRGLLMGNRGCLHGQGRELGKSRWRSKLWICCLLSYKDVQRDPMPPGRWTALFFLDEATALAAGHRPCGYCRRADYLAYGQAWQRAHRLADRPKAPEMDAQLHRERVHSRTRIQRTHEAPLRSLPDGVMVRHDGEIALVVRERLLPWSLRGYAQPLSLAPATVVEVLTPAASVAVLASGYRPMLHPSSRAMQLRVSIAVEQLQSAAGPKGRLLPGSLAGTVGTDRGPVAASGVTEAL
ncbi:hypothetical protein [Catelliglobosispora koreensis]|uniref:hypothetical protein n=1 Tax=Catelliglobosispora koreensis TaxID=129052 RepID=UPI00037A2C53|nr:hypothetical protein [Catelliglobosispora koreensis]